jgi:2TM domain
MIFTITKFNSSNMYKQPDIHDEAERRVKAKAKFYKHFFAYVVVNSFLLLTAFFQGEPFGTFPVLLGWGLGLAFHYLKVFGIPGSGVLSKDWEDKEYQKELERLEQKQQGKHQRPEEKLELKEMAKNYRDSDLV